MEDLLRLFKRTFPPLLPQELAYLPRLTAHGPTRLAFRFTIQQVTIAAAGWTGGIVAAVTGVFRTWEAMDDGPLEYGEAVTDTLRVEFERERDLNDGEAWARGLRERITREYPGVVAGVEAAPSLVVLADFARMGLVT